MSLNRKQFLSRGRFLLGVGCSQKNWIEDSLQHLKPISFYRQHPSTSSSTSFAEIPIILENLYVLMYYYTLLVTMSWLFDRDLSAHLLAANWLAKRVARVNGYLSLPWWPISCWLANLQKSNSDDNHWSNFSIRVRGSLLIRWNFSHYR